MSTLVALVMTILNMLYTVACVQIQFQCPFLTIETLSKKDRLFCYPKDIPGRYYGGRSVNGRRHVCRCEMSHSSRFGGEHRAAIHTLRNKITLKAT